MSGIQSLNEYLFLLVCLDLDLSDTLALRQVCRSFNRATRAKLLWINLLKRTAESGGRALPLHLKPCGSLDGRALEALVVRVSQLARRWKKQDLCPVDVWRLDISRSITWLRLVVGNWLFVASSDHDVSKISCWDLSLVFQGYTEPIAEAYLPGQVETAQLELQDVGVVLALGVANSRSASVRIITLQQRAGSHCFVELFHVDGSSDVLMLQGKYVGCGVRDGAVVPHIIDWVASTTYDLPLSVEGFDTPERRFTPHLLVIWNEFVVVVRHRILDIYTRPSETSTPRYIKSLRTIPISEVVILNPLALPSESPLRLLVISARTVQLITVELGLLLDVAFCSHTLLAETSTPDPEHPWYHLRTSGDGSRAHWLGVGLMALPRTTDFPHIISVAIPSQPSETLPPLITWTNDVAPDAGIWAFPALDFDDALGYTVVGNLFGELVIYSHAASDPLACCGLAPDFTYRPSPAGTMLSLEPIPLRMRPIPLSDLEVLCRDAVAELTEDWADEDLPLNPAVWKTDWRPEAYYYWYHWLGVVGDTAWLLRHAFRFPGRATPQAHVVTHHKRSTASLSFRIRKHTISASTVMAHKRSNLPLLNADCVLEICSYLLDNRPTGRDDTSNHACLATKYYPARPVWHVGRENHRDLISFASTCNTYADPALYVLWTEIDGVLASGKFR
ncbi:hypothetical protein C8R46DRAFT_1285226 [Mycena filopes]|nr:hypothetical protein C8R46DRAFT_1285226 [Mycena filopes]